MLQIGVLFQKIRGKGVSGVSDLGSKLGLTSVGVSHAPDRLVQEELIARSEDLKTSAGAPDQKNQPTRGGFRLDIEHRKGVEAECYG